MPEADIRSTTDALRDHLGVPVRRKAAAAAEPEAVTDVELEAIPDHDGGDE
jgi:hypothetical protein